MIDKSKMKGYNEVMLTQSLFINFSYDESTAIYCWDEEDKVYKGKTYPSLKRLYLETEDPTEYEFAKKHLLGWKHWVRLNNNKILKEHFDEWRDELEIKLRSQAVLSIIDQSGEDRGFQAAKWLADRGWDKKGPGRPSNAEKEKNAAVAKRVAEEFEDDIERMQGH